MRKLLFPLILGLCPAVSASAADGEIPDWAKGVKATQTLDKPDPTLKVLLFSDPATWGMSKDKDGHGCLELAYNRKTYKSTYAPKHRSPIHIAMLKQNQPADFVMDIELMSTTEEYDHQSLCLFFNVQSPEKYYYVHLGRKADMNANNVFIVNEAPRKNFAKETTKGTAWKKDTWHKARLVRQGSTGKIEVYFDDMTKPIMKAEDKTFQEGYVGFGSFDDTGRFRNLTVYSKDQPNDKQPDFFRPIEKKKIQD